LFDLTLIPSRPAPGGLNRDYEQNRMEMTNNQESGMFETTFGVDGEIETYTNEKPVSMYRSSF